MSQGTSCWEIPYWPKAFQVILYMQCNPASCILNNCERSFTGFFNPRGAPGSYNAAGNTELGAHLIHYRLICTYITVCVSVADLGFSKEGFRCPERFRLRLCVHMTPAPHARKTTKRGVPWNPLDQPLCVCVGQCGEGQTCLPKTLVAPTAQ